MEYVVIFNMGFDAARTGKDRMAPDTVDYPIYSRYVEFHHVKANLNQWQKAEWLRGYDKGVI